MYRQRFWPRHRRRGYGSPALLGGAVGNDAARRCRVHSAGSRDGNHGADNTGHTDSAGDLDTAANRHAAADGNPTVNRDAPGYGDPEYQWGHHLPRQHEF
jgi:hypothetical protein